MLKLPQLTRAGKTVRLFRETELTFPLLSVGQFCAADCAAHIDKHETRICDPTGTCFLRESAIGPQACILPPSQASAPPPLRQKEVRNYPNTHVK
jgi:hypothetical protein